MNIVMLEWFGEMQVKDQFFLDHGIYRSALEQFMKLILRAHAQELNFSYIVQNCSGILMFTYCVYKY